MAEIELAAYADDCLVRARLDLPTGIRLSDYVNERESLTLTAVQLMSHSDGHIVRLESLELVMDDIFAMEAPDTTASSGPRIRTRTSRVEIELGPYRILGYLHGPTSGDPFAAITRRKPMVPITEATIAFNLAGAARMRDAQVVIVNRLRASLVQRVVPEHEKLDDFGFSQVDPRAKDLTHELSYGLEDPGDPDTSE
jgi:hypothetical protein